MCLEVNAPLALERSGVRSVAPARTCTSCPSFASARAWYHAYVPMPPKPVSGGYSKERRAMRIVVEVGVRG